MRQVRLRRDRQQWIFDYIVKETGRVFHWDEAGRGSLPDSVKSHAQISKHLGRSAQRYERVAQEEEAAGHTETAMDLYYRASDTYAAAQHPILEDDNDEKAYLHGRALATFEKVMEHAPYPIERVEVPWEGQQIQCNLHLLPDRRKAPCVIFIPGCDMTKEMYPNPRVVHAHQRGMHLLVMDGPGQGTSNLRKIKVTADNYERAGSAVIDYLQTRDEIDADNITVYAISMGSFWGMQLAAHDQRVKALAAPWASYIDKYFILDTFSPRYKQLFGYLTGAANEEELDSIVADMTLAGREQEIKCPVLMTVGEYDSRSPIELIYDMYEQITAPKELWVYEDTYHQARMFAGGDQANHDNHLMAVDWLRDAIHGKFGPGHARSLYLPTNGGGPNGPGVEGRDALHWWQTAGP